MNYFLKGGSMNIEKLINRYLDGETNPQERKEVEEKLVNDPEFATIYTKLSEVDTLLQKIENSVVPEDIHKRVLNSVKYKTKEKPFFIRFAPALVGSMMSFTLGIMFSSFMFGIQDTNTNYQSSYNNDLYSTLEINDVIDYYYDK